ncbi:MAG TPA: sulfatase [Thermoanaerobaculia bacterium]|nr:sulfatase [Thermoanaerobaculia bacterium]
MSLPLCTSSEKRQPDRGRQQKKGSGRAGTLLKTWAWGILGLAGVAAFAGVALGSFGGIAQARQAERTQRFPNVLIITIDTLRADRVSGFGYRRPTTPHLDKLLASGVRFRQARTVEPLTNPALCSLFTSSYPHEHGATRNGLRMRPGLPSLASTLGRRGFRTAAFVGNWTLRNEISGLGEHFDRYDEVLNRKRWYGLFAGEATAEDLTDSALSWLDDHRKNHRRPFLLWVHYVEPHAPYRLQEDFARRLGVATRGDASKSDRYDTEIAFADYHAGRLLSVLEADPALQANTLVIFTADHGESLGEHSYWGHGRNLYDPTLRIPLGMAWPGRIRPGVIEAPAFTLDVAPTTLGLAGLPVPGAFQGYDWTPVIEGREAPRERVLRFEAHKGAVLSSQEAASARRKGLLEVALLSGGQKEIFRVNEGKRWIFDLTKDPRELRGRLVTGKGPSPPLRDWLAGVHRGLEASDRVLTADVDPEDVEQLRALGYVD